MLTKYEPNVLPPTQEKTSFVKSSASEKPFASSTTLLYYFGLGNKLTFIADDNMVKQHRFSPGYHIPILSGQALYEQNPDYVIILPWRFGQMIISKHQEYLQQGGHFIIPLPDIEII